MTSAGPHVGMSIGDMSLATANLIHSYALPLLIVGAILTLAGTIGVFVSDGVRGRYAAQALKIASLPSATPQTVRVQAIDPSATKPGMTATATPTTAASAVASPASAGAQAQMMTATAAPQTVTPPSESVSAANTLQDGAEAPVTPPEPSKVVARSLNDKQRANMLAALHGQAEDVWFVTERDPEAQHFADQLGAVFREAGWTDHHALVLHPGQPFQGVSAALKTTSADRSVSRAFSAAGLSLTFREKAADEPAPTVYVGRPNAAP